MQTEDIVKICVHHKPELMCNISEHIAPTEQVPTTIVWWNHEWNSGIINFNENFPIDINEMLVPVKSNLEQQVVVNKVQG